MQHKAVRFSLIVLLFLLWPAAGHAEGWKAVVSPLPHGPVRFVGIDKDEQSLYLFRRQSPLRVERKYVCTTGQASGDKAREGDLRTPEGVYFIERRLDSGLDWDLYGGLAHTLNYPNPVDVLNGKTGSGIWIHGRGQAVTPRETKGCVALNSPDMSHLDPELVGGMPVVIARDVEMQNANTPEYEAEEAEVLERLRGWAGAWRERSEDYLDYYDGDKYSRAQRRSFASFASHKRNLFGRLPYVQLMLSDVQALKGPDYWVTWFGQFYRANTLVSQGIKRLYWQRDDEGVFRIVGREWQRKNLNLLPVFRSRVEASARSFVERWRKTWEAGDLDGYVRVYDDRAVQGSRIGKSAIREHKIGIWGSAAPESVEFDNIRVSLHSEGAQVEFVQKYRNTSGYADVGVKTLVLRPVGDAWTILREEWRAL